MNSLFDFLLKLNHPQRGSFGEFIFFNELRKMGWQIESMHEARVDFIVNGSRRIDVKTSFSKIAVEKNQTHYGYYSGTRYQGIEYAFVELFSNGIRITIDKELISELSISQVKVYWEGWREERKVKYLKHNSKRNTARFSSIKAEVQEFFIENLELEARVIYRTVQKGFGKESPDNLIPKIINKNNTTIFIDFMDQHISRDNIRRIVAFPDACSKSFPLLSKPTLHLEKVDLGALDSKYVFNDLEDLFQNFEHRLLNSVDDY